MYRSTSSRLALQLLQTPAAPTATRAYVTAKSASGSGSRKKAALASGAKGSRPGEGAGDARIETIKNLLYEPGPSDADRLAALSRVIPSAEAHETVQRAWALHQRHRRESHSAELARKYASMRAAIDLLEQTDKALWEKAVGGKKFQNVDQSNATNARLEGIVPRELRVPMEQPGGQVWDSEWKAPAAAPSGKA
ncbi:SPOSA6832_04468, partial [Sporobolomyces salmonicolor]